MQRQGSGESIESIRYGNSTRVDRGGVMRLFERRGDRNCATRALAGFLSAVLLIGASVSDAEARARPPAPRRPVMPPYGPSPADRLTMPVPNDEVPRPPSSVSPQEQFESSLSLSEPAVPPPMPLPLAPRIPTDVVTAPPPPGVGTIVSLIQSLVQEGVLAQDRANALIRQARDEVAIAARAPRQEELASLAAPNAAAANPPAGIPTALPGEPAPQMASANQPPTIRVPYVPQFVRNQIKAEIE